MSHVFHFGREIFLGHISGITITIHTGTLQWTYPDTGIAGGTEEMELCTTPPPESEELSVSGISYTDILFYSVLVENKLN